MRFRLTLNSGNRKTGPIPVSTSSKDTCPVTCPVHSECYARFHWLGLRWKQLDTSGLDWSGFINAVRQLPIGTLWRHNQAGDLVHEYGVINLAKLKELVSAAKHTRGFTFTHHILNTSNTESIRHANVNGFTINISCESGTQVDEAMDRGLPAICITAMDAPKILYTPKQRRVVRCPATWRNTNCSLCGLCARAGRDYAIGFPAHGTKARALETKVDSLLSNETTADI